MYSTRMNKSIDQYLYHNLVLDNRSIKVNNRHKIPTATEDTD